MTEPPTALINIGELSKPATVLIEKLSDAVGGLCAPWQIKRVAKAEAEAEMIRAQAAIQVTDVQRRAMIRSIQEQGQHQSNMESIVAQALPQLGDGAKANEIDNDWVSAFFAKCRIVSNAEMQSLWSRVLAGEANKPGSFSKRTVNFLGDLDKADAEAFQALCGFAWLIGGIVPLVFDAQGLKTKMYTANGVTFDSLIHLESIGLIQLETNMGFVRQGLPRSFAVGYYGTRLVLDFGKDSDNQLSCGKVVLTKMGEELAPISGSKPVPGFFEYVKERWKTHLKDKPSEETWTVQSKM